MSSVKANNKSSNDSIADQRIECGIIMPIATMPNYPAGHWEAMLELASRGIRKAGMVPMPVWANGPADVIQERIVRNLYEQPYAVCDVSGLNPNVMLELGIRLAFGKPTIIINDEKVRTPFDIGPTEYVPYDQSLHFQKAEEFVLRLSDKISSVKILVDNGDYRPFIKTFGPIELGTPGSDAVPIGEAVLDQLAGLAAEIRNIRGNISSSKPDVLSSVEDEMSVSTALNTGLRFTVNRLTSSPLFSALSAKYPDYKVLRMLTGDTIIVGVPASSMSTRNRIRAEIARFIRDFENEHTVTLTPQE